jgi:maltose/moltooligosaccharide transporter
MGEASAPGWRQVLPRLFAIQFLSWSGMFCLWIYALPVIAGRVLHAAPDTPAYQNALVAMAVCFALYGLLGIAMSFLIPRALARWGAGVVHGTALLAGAAGIAALGAIDRPAGLLPAFLAIGIGWGSLSSVPYAVAGAAAPEGRGAHTLRLFGLSTVLPQIATTLCIALLAPAWIGHAVHRVMFAGGIAMACAGLLAFAWRAFLPVAAEDW